MSHYTKKTRRRGEISPEVTVLPYFSLFKRRAMYDFFGKWRLYNGICSFEIYFGLVVRSTVNRTYYSYKNKVFLQNLYTIYYIYIIYIYIIFDFIQFIYYNFRFSSIDRSIERSIKNNFVKWRNMLR